MARLDTLIRGGTMVRGQVVAENGRLLGRKGLGRHPAREKYAPVTGYRPAA